TRRRARPPVLPVLPTAIDLTPLARPSAGTVHATRCHTKVCATSRRVNCVLGTVFDVPADRKADEPPASDGRATRWNDHKARRRAPVGDVPAHRGAPTPGRENPPAHRRQSARRARPRPPPARHGAP